MGRYDNFDNSKRIEKLQKEIDKLSKKRKPNYYKIDILKKQLENLKLFTTCQIFGRDPTSFLASDIDPNLNILFSDDNEVMLFCEQLIPYSDIESCRFVANKVTRSNTTTRKKGTISRAIVGGVIAGGVGAIVGAASAHSQSNTTYHEYIESFTLEVSLKSGKTYSCTIRNPFGGEMRKLPQKWVELGEKINMIIEENSNDSIEEK